MHCPFCSKEETKVIDSRLVGDGNQVRRRRECVVCSERFTTYETAELLMPRVVKSDDRREPFDEEGCWPIPLRGCKLSGHEPRTENRNTDLRLAFVELLVQRL